MTDDEPPEPEPTQPRPKRQRPSRKDVTFTLATLAGLVVSLVGVFVEGRTGSELETLRRLAIACTAVAAAAIVVGFWPWTLNKRIFTLVLAGVAVLALVVALFQPQVRNLVDPPCEDPIELTVAVPDEGASGFIEVVEAFASLQRDGDDCRTVSVAVLPVSWPEAQSAFDSGWDDEATMDLGARPDVWIAESSTQIELAAELTPDGGPLGGEPTPIGSTPLVFAVPTERADGPAEELFENMAGPEGPSIVRPDPEASFAALYHLDWIYGLAPGATWIEQRIEAGLAFHNVGKVDDDELMCRLHGGPSQQTGVLTTERSMAVYNNADMGSDCPQSDRPQTALTATYPNGGGSLDYTALHLDWPDREEADGDVEAERERAAAGLVAWLAEPDGQAALADIGIRTEADPTLLSADGGVDLDLAPDVNRPPVDLIASLEQRFGESRVPTRVLLAVDNSGSMAAPAGGAEGTLADLTLTGAETALSAFGAADEFGVWTFPGGSDMEPEELVAIGPADDERRDAAIAELERREPAGDTPLYHTISEGVAALDGGDGDHQAFMVVLTDGENDDDVHDIGLAELTGTVEEADVQLYVITVAGATCESTGLGPLAEVSRGRCESVQARALEATFAEMFGQIWGGDG